MIKHTPGPWQVHRDNVTVGDGPTSVIARCYYPADARLIATAPKLLATLTKLVAGHLDTYHDGDSADCDSAFTHAEWCAARALLEGRE